MISQKDDNLLLASSSKDNSMRIWDAKSSNCLMVMTGHTASVTKVLWGGENLLYTAS